jgi:RNA-directed DNA polymerase
MGKHPKAFKGVAKLLKRQEGNCAYCGLHFREEDVVKIEHITLKSKGGKGEYKSLQLLHRDCHEEKRKRLPEMSV